MLIFSPVESFQRQIAWVEAFVGEAGATGTTDIQLNNGTNDILSTVLTIDTGEYWSGYAATPAVVDNSYRPLSDVDFIDVDIDAVSTTEPMDLTVILYLTRL